MAETPVKEAPAEEETQAEVEEVHTEETEGDGSPGKPEEKQPKGKLIVILLLCLAVVGAVGAYFFLIRDKDDGRIPYAPGVVLYEVEDIEPASEGWMNLRYYKKAFSNDGVRFTGMLANDPGNVYDMYFDIYADSNFADRVFLSGLVQPGYAFQEIILSHALPAGTTTCYVVHNQVDTDAEGNQSIVNQLIVTVDFVVE